MLKIKRGKYWSVRSGNGYIFEHRLVMEKHLGRKLLDTEAIHHMDRNPENNDISNLQLFSSHGQHTKIGHPEIRESQKILFKGKHFSPTTEFKKGDNIGNTNGFIAGQKAWNKDKPWSEEHKQKLKVAHIGKHKSNVTSFKKGMIPWNKKI